MTDDAKRVLIVEDNDVFAGALRLLVEQTGLAGVVDRVATGGECLARLATVHYDLVLLDPGLPNGRGLESIERVMGAPLVPPCVVLTGSVNDDDRYAALELGVQEYASKDDLGLRGAPWLSDLMRRALARSEGVRRRHVGLLRVLPP